MREGLDKITIT